MCRRKWIAHIYIWESSHQSGSKIEGPGRSFLCNCCNWSRVNIVHLYSGIQSAHNLSSTARLRGQMRWQFLHESDKTLRFRGVKLRGRQQAIGATEEGGFAVRSRWDTVKWKRHFWLFGGVSTRFHKKWPEVSAASGHLVTVVPFLFFRGLFFIFHFLFFIFYFLFVDPSTQSPGGTPRDLEPQGLK